MVNEELPMFMPIENFSKRKLNKKQVAPIFDLKN